MWKIWYADGSTFDSDDGNPEDAPGWGVVVIAQTGGNHDHPFLVASHEFATVHGYDWYVRRGGYWFATNLMGLCQYFATPGFKVVKMGQWVDHHEWEQIRARADRWRTERL